MHIGSIGIDLGKTTFRLGYNPRHLIHSPLALDWMVLKSSHRWARAEWERCIAHATLC